MFPLTSFLPTPSVRLWTVSLTFCYVLLGQTLGPCLKEHLSPLPSPPLVPSQFRWYKAYDGRSKHQPKPVAANGFQETDWNSSGHWRRVTLQLSFATEPHGPGSSDTEPVFIPRAKAALRMHESAPSLSFPTSKVNRFCMLARVSRDILHPGDEQPCPIHFPMAASRLPTKEAAR